MPNRISLIKLTDEYTECDEEVDTKDKLDPCTARQKKIPFSNILWLIWQSHDKNENKHGHSKWTLQLSPKHHNIHENYKFPIRKTINEFCPLQLLQLSVKHFINVFKKQRKTCCKENQQQLKNDKNYTNKDDKIYPPNKVIKQLSFSVLKLTNIALKVPR